MADEEKVKPEANQAPPPEQGTSKLDAEAPKNDEQGDLGADEGHEVVHKDEYEREDTKAIRRVNIMLISLSIVGMIITLTAIFYLFSSFESIEVISTEQVDPLVTLEGHIYYQNDGMSPAVKLHQITNGPAEQELTFDQSGQLEPVTDNRNPTWQIARNGGVVAYQTDGSDVVRVKTGVEESEAFGELNGQLQDWVLTADGSYVFGLLGGSQLVPYDISHKETSVIDENFTIKGSVGDTRLFYGSDGTISWFRFADRENLNVIYHDISSGEANEPITINSPRFPSGAQLSRNSLSPDGQGLLFEATIDGDNYLWVVSLNSRTVRPVFVASPGTRIGDYVWAPDSRTVAVAEVQGNRTVRIERLDTGPLTRETLINRSSDGINIDQVLVRNMSFAPDSEVLSFVNNGTLFGVQVDYEEPDPPKEGDEAVEPESRIQVILNDVSAVDDIQAYGWISRIASP